jgi:two-component system chemotaxis sensor kinase CheA
MVRNSCDHGLEGPEDRVAAGKSEEGTVILSAFHEGGHIIIEIIDDGHGINVERVRQKITENNLASESELENMSEQQIIQYIFKAGFSTAEQVTAVSGRGVGMDVVRTNIEKIGGTIELSSETGKGSTFHIKIPLTLAIVSVLVVESCGQKFALPQINVVELVRSGEDSEHIIETINDSPVLRLRDKILPLLSLERVLQLDPSENDHSEDDLLDDIFIVVCKVGGTEFGIIVDQIYDTEEIVVKPVSSMLQDIPVYSGNTILGDGSVIMILDPNGLSQETGELETQTSDDDSMAEAESESITTFLLFTVGDDAPKAVPLELVSRLEEIEAKDVETTGEYKVIQYRGDLMRLVTLDDVNVIPEEGTCEVIVFNYDNKVLGLVVENILDIVETRLDIKLASDKPDLLGSMVVNGKTTDVVDVGTLLSELVGEVTTNNTGSEEERSKNILFVEDSPFFRNLTVPFLSGVGYDVTALESAKKGLEVLEQRDDIDLIITDIEMPEMDGIQFAAVCRADASLSHIPIIAFTSTTNDNLKQNKQFDDYILKTNREDLLNAISGQLTQKREVA